MTFIFSVYSCLCLTWDRTQQWSWSYHIHSGFVFVLYRFKISAGAGFRYRATFSDIDDSVSELYMVSHQCYCRHMNQHLSYLRFTQQPNTWSGHKTARSVIHVHVQVSNLSWASWITSSSHEEAWWLLVTLLQSWNEEPRGQKLRR